MNMASFVNHTLSKVDLLSMTSSVVRSNHMRVSLCLRVGAQEQPGWFGYGRRMISNAVLICLYCVNVNGQLGRRG